MRTTAGGVVGSSRRKGASLFAGRLGAELVIVAGMRRAGRTGHLLHDGADRYVLHHSTVPAARCGTPAEHRRRADTASVARGLSPALRPPRYGKVPSPGGRQACPAQPRCRHDRHRRPAGGRNGPEARDRVRRRPRAHSVASGWR